MLKWNNEYQRIRKVRIILRDRTFLKINGKETNIKYQDCFNKTKKSLKDDEKVIQW